ncbi:hypothetical protein Pla108_13410 [Botrimarina colliarenosi]|uniref:N-acetyltransferase domain-containing protein n=1 Tax=Botrimarina colliarenosi TaxID=2528001 RepID=A0A5C6ALU5_9BACT|nr:hypothetical protein [Botrimarina colliarenosi]TWU00391.1 hypothetical protein Pla108_13410 [Botrimarina colliarenosi]
MTSYPIQLRRRADGQLIDAELVDGIRPQDLVEIEQEWRSVRDEIRQKLAVAGVQPNGPGWPESLHWDWRDKVGKLNYLGTQGWAIRCEGRWQGAMLYDDTSHFAKDPADRGKPLVYIDYIESAPWNWLVDSIGQKGEFKSVGVRLFEPAVNHSMNEEYHGRVGLHALPTAEATYLAWGLEAFGPDPSFCQLSYFELTRAAATKWGKTI